VDDGIAEPLGRSLGTFDDDCISLGALHRIDEVLWLEREHTKFCICKYEVTDGEETVFVSMRYYVWLERELAFVNNVE
jgi:hypothetical protein